MVVSISVDLIEKKMLLIKAVFILIFAVVLLAAEIRFKHVINNYLLKNDFTREQIQPPKGCQ